MDTTRVIVRFILTFAIACAATVSAAAFTMEPMVSSIIPGTNGSITTFRFKNDGGEAIALRLRMMARSQSAEGAETLVPADDSFDIYPARLVVQPGTTAAAKIRWKGNASPERELAFRLIAEQVPVDFAAASPSSGLRILFRYVASVYVTKPAFRPSLSATVKPGLGSAGEPGFWVTLVNSGSRHVVAGELRIEIWSANVPEATFEPAALDKLNGLNYLPGGARTMFLPAPGVRQGGSYEAVVRFDPSE